MPPVGKTAGMTFLAGLPAILRFLIYLLVVVFVIIFLAWILHGAGGFDWHLGVGHFHWDIGVT
jgi:hypothetical protein